MQKKEQIIFQAIIRKVSRNKNLKNGLVSFEKIRPLTSEILSLTFLSVSGDAQELLCTRPY